MLLYIYQEKLSEEDIELVEAHLCTCPCCNRELNSLRKTISLINQVELRFPPSEELKARIYNRIESNGWFEQGLQ